MRDYSDQIDTRDPDRDVQITSLDACVVEGNFEWNLIKVETDAGVTGIGEAYRGGGVPELVEYTNRFLVGENPLDVERLVRYIFQEMSGHGGTTGKVVTAASGIEIALLDAAGRSSGSPSTNCSARSTATRSGSTATATPAKRTRSRTARPPTPGPRRTLPRRTPPRPPASPTWAFRR